MVFYWPHFLNIHRHIANEREPDTIFEDIVCITQKIDGSNLTIHILKKDSEWEIVGLYGRNSVIWTPESTVFYDKLSYGQPGNLENLPLAMKEFAVKLAKKLNVDNICVTGEAFRDNHKYASWHPFGYAIPKINDIDIKTDETNFERTMNTYYLTSDTHELFVQCSENVSFSNFTTKLKEAKCNCVFPPPLLFTGSLSDGISSLYDAMCKLTPKFEGSFIISEKKAQKIYESYNLTTSNDSEKSDESAKSYSNDETIGYKWKTGLHDEQPVIKSVDEILFIKKESIDTYIKLVEIYNNNNKPKKKNAKTIEHKILEKSLIPETTNPLLEKQLTTDIVIAFKREITKQIPITKIPKNKRNDIIKNMIICVIKEIKTIYSESDIPFPYSSELFNKQVQCVVKSLVNKEPYIK